MEWPLLVSRLLQSSRLPEQAGIDSRSGTNCSKFLSDRFDLLLKLESHEEFRALTPLFSLHSALDRIIELV